VIWLLINQHAELTETLKFWNSSKLYRKYLGSEHDLQKIPGISEPIPEPNHNLAGDFPSIIVSMKFSHIANNHLFQTPATLND
jgi:hypothetical protein